MNNIFTKSSFYNTGITGKVTIDENGDRDADYSILDLNPDTEKFEVTFGHIFLTIRL